MHVNKKNVQMHYGMADLIFFASYSRPSMAQTGLGPLRLVLDKGSSCHPERIMHKMTCRDLDDSSSQPR